MFQRLEVKGQRHQLPRRRRVRSRGDAALALPAFDPRQGGVPRRRIHHARRRGTPRRRRRRRALVSVVRRRPQGREGRSRRPGGGVLFRDGVFVRRVLLLLDLREEPRRRRSAGGAAAAVLLPSALRRLGRRRLGRRLGRQVLGQGHAGREDEGPAPLDRQEVAVSREEEEGDLPRPVLPRRRREDVDVAEVRRDDGHLLVLRRLPEQFLVRLSGGKPPPFLGWWSFCRWLFEKNLLLSSLGGRRRRRREPARGRLHPEHQRRVEAEQDEGRQREDHRGDDRHEPHEPPGPPPSDAGHEPRPRVRRVLLLLL
mmetsp:Transcript_4447/g.14757  ORF Transcript_4447/g.14757 Transcript_4447/m.14757 type:complete len:312 (-) Transcript_4447:697-1632(-)